MLRLMAEPERSIPLHWIERWEKMEARELREELRSFFRMWTEQSDKVSHYKRWFDGLREMLNVEERPGPEG